ncbi:MAG: hypothetical protein ACREEC_07045 [Thermoplasmata archaeon]
MASNLIGYQPTTGTLFGLPRDGTSVSAPLVVESTDPEQMEISVLTGDWLVVFPVVPGQGSQAPVPHVEETGPSQEEPPVTETMAPALSEDEDPLLAALWDNPEDDCYDAP